MPTRTAPLLSRHRLALAALAAAHVGLSLALSPGWIFAKYPNLAAGLRAGALTPAQVADASPAYLLLHLLLAPGWLRALQLAAGAAAVVAVALVAERARGPGAGLLAAAALALAQPWILYGAVLEPDLLVGALGAAAAAALALGARDALRTPALAGGLLGFSFALRPTVLPFALAAGAWLLVELRRAGVGPRRAGAGLAAGAAAFALAALLPAAALSLRARTEWQGTMSAGQVIHQGHRPESSGLGATYPTLLKAVELAVAARPGHPPDFAHELYRRFAAAAEGRPLDAAEAERFWAARAAAFAAEEPGALARLVLRKLAFAIAAPGRDADIRDAQAVAERWRTPAPGLRAIALAGAAGLLLSIRRRGAERLVTLWIASYLVVFAVFYYQTRYALAILPAWAILAGAGAAALRDARDRPRVLARRAALAAAPLALLALPFVRAEARLEERVRAAGDGSAIAALRASGDRAAARERLADALAALPDGEWPWSPHGLALDARDPALALAAAERARARWGDEAPLDAYVIASLYARGGRCDLALPLADLAARADFAAAVQDTALDPDLLAAACLRERMEPAAALARIRRSLARRPGTREALAHALAAADAVPGLARAAERAGWERKLFRLHDPASARWTLARARRAWGDPGRALADAEWLRAHVPDAAPFAEFERAQALLDLGRTQEALAAYARSLALPFAMHGMERFDAPLRALVEARPGATAVAAVALSHFLRRGDTEQVRTLVARHPELAPGTAAFAGAPPAAPRSAAPPPPDGERRLGSRHPRLGPG